MTHIERVDISGFWGDRDLTLELFQDANFLIGPNGSGKTTAINTIAAALAGDFANLDRLPFRSILITLYDPETRRKPSVEVRKKERKRSPFPSIQYSIRESARGEASHYSLDEFEEERLYRDYPSHRVRQSRFYRHAVADVTHRLRQIAPTSWLSIHRAAGPRHVREERSYEFTVDQKLDEISDSLVRFFSELEKRSTDEAHKFQETIFLSLIYEHKEDELFKAVQDLDLQKEQEALIEIFKKFNVQQTRFLNKTETHFRNLSKIVRKFEKQSGISITDVLLLMNSWRIHSVIQDWKSLISRQQEIFKPRDTFLELLNNMLQRKELKINDRNEIIAETQSGKTLTPAELSSGEKQLLIILGEALLQKSAPWIYIADEPELSLHVNWQVVLVDNLREMNPSSQIIVATHSPDIVSHYSDRVHDMEKALS